MMPNTIASPSHSNGLANTVERPGRFCDGGVVSERAPTSAGACDDDEVVENPASGTRVQVRIHGGAVGRRERAVEVRGQLGERVSCEAHVSSLLTTGTVFCSLIRQSPSTRGA